VINIGLTAVPCRDYLLSPRAIYGSLASPNGSTPTVGSLGNILHAEGVRAAHNQTSTLLCNGTFHFSRVLVRFQTAVLTLFWAWSIREAFGATPAILVELRMLPWGGVAKRHDGHYYSIHPEKHGRQSHEQRDKSSIVLKTDYAAAGLSDKQKTSRRNPTVSVRPALVANLLRR
jgi:hypothetical protein